MKQTIKLLVCLAILGVASPAHLASAQKKSVIKDLEFTISNFNKGLAEKNDSLLTSNLDPDFAVGIYTMPSSKTSFNAIVKGEEISSVKILSFEEQKKFGTVQHIAQSEITTKNGNITTKIAFNSDNKILYIDHFDKLYGYDREQKSKVAAKIPFEYDKGIIINVRLNNNPNVLRFLFDTGANGMAIGPQLAAELGIKADTEQNTSVVGGERKIQISKGNTVNLTETVALENQNIAIFPNEIGGGFDGIIGLNIPKNYITEVNFDENIMTINSFGDYTPKGPIQPITLPHGVIIIPGFIDIVGKGAVQGKFVMDTGAGYNFIAFNRFVRKNRMLLSGFKYEKQSATVSLGVTTPTYEGYAHKFGLNDQITFDKLYVSLQASSSNSDFGTDEDGSIGIELLHNYNFTINLLDKYVEFRKRDK